MNKNMIKCELSRQYNLYELRCEDPPCSIVVQNDYDYPFLARLVGWDGKVGDETCKHLNTDGTVDCPVCGMTISSFLIAAQEYLDYMEGEVEIDENMLSDYV
jgi:hypothetical protein